MLVNSIFSVVSNADLGLEKYYLNDEGYYHILLGHRDLKSIVIMGIEDTVKNPTHVYRSSYDVKRFQFLSYNVLIARGHPMNVIIEAESNLGRVVTASPRKSASGHLVWDKVTGLYASYDKNSDILYFSHGDSRSAYADDDPTDERIWLRFYEDDESPAGVTVFQATRIWSEQHEKLIARVSDFLQVQQTDVEGRIRGLLKVI